MNNKDATPLPENDRLDAALAWAQKKVDEGAYKPVLTVVDIGRMGAAKRWENHENKPTTTVRVAVEIADRIKTEIPKRERREFVDNALTQALDERPSPSKSSEPPYSKGPEELS